jgi:hypothetical protein
MVSFEDVDVDVDADGSWEELMGKDLIMKVSEHACRTVQYSTVQYIS